jgi:hypothetical protein
LGQAIAFRTELTATLVDNKSDDVKTNYCKRNKSKKGEDYYFNNSRKTFLEYSAIIGVIIHMTTANIKAFSHPM